MASQADAQGANRVITHMNAQHALELSHYLRHHHTLPARRASPATLTAITFTSMTITDGDGKPHTVPINPPLGSWADARTRLADMDTEARKHLGLSDVTLDTWQAPRVGVEALTFSGVVLFIFCYATLPHVTPGSRAWSLLDQFWPLNGATSYKYLVSTTFWPIAGIHLFEVALLDAIRMRPYGVARFSKLWWSWELTCLIEGFGTFKRTKDIVDAKRAEKEKAGKSH